MGLSTCLLPTPHQPGQSPPERLSLGQFLKSQLLPGLNSLLVLFFFFFTFYFEVISQRKVARITQRFFMYLSLISSDVNIFAIFVSFYHDGILSVFFFFSKWLRISSKYDIPLPLNTLMYISFFVYIIFKNNFY